MPASRSSTHHPIARGPDDRAAPLRRRRGVRALLAAVLGLALMGFAAPTASAAPWACDGSGFVTMYQGTVGDQTLLTRVVREADGTYGFENRATSPGRLINAIGFRAQDGFLYGWQNQANGLVRIEDDGAGGAIFGPVQTVPGITSFGAFAGTFLADGRYFIWGTPANPVGYIIDLSGPTPTLDTAVTASWDASGAGMPLGDFAVSPVDGNLYAIVGSQLRQLTLSGSTLSLGPVVGPTAGQGANGSAGAQWFSPAGAQGTFVYSGNHADGTVHIFTTNLATDVVSDLGSVGETVPNGDGAACANTLAVTKDADPRSVTAGTELTYTYTITARGLVDNPVEFVDTLPAGLTYVPGGVTINGTFGAPNNYAGTNSLSISGVIPRNTTVTITARVLVAADHACGVNVPNQAQATMTPAGLPPVTVGSDDPDTPTDPTDPTIIHVNCSADVGIVKTASTSPIVPGEEATFTFVATNNGPSIAQNVAASDPLPAGFTFGSASPGCTEAGGILTCTVGTLAPGASQTYTVTGEVASDIEERLCNTATVTTTTPDPNAGNNSSTVCPPIEGESDLSIRKDASSATVAPGGQVMFTLVVRNVGPSDDPSAEVIDPLVSGLTLVSAEPSQGTCSTANNTLNCDLGRLKDRGSAQVLVTAQMTASTCVTNTAQVRGAHEDPTPENNQDSAQVCPGPPPDPRFDLEVTKTVNDRTLVIGQTATYRVVVRNNGPDTATNAVVPDTLNAPVKVVSVRTPQGSCTKRIPMRCELGTIAAGDSVRITIRVKHRESGCRQRNAASATGDGTDTNPANNMDTVDVCVRKVRLRLSKVASRSRVQGGETFSYRIRVRNPTKGEARNVKVCDRLPSGIRYVSSKPRARVRGRQQCWTIKRLGARKSRTFRITVRAANGASGRKVNRATLTSPDTRRLRARDAVRINPQPDRPTG